MGMRERMNRSHEHTLIELGANGKNAHGCTTFLSSRSRSEKERGRTRTSTLILPSPSASAAAAAAVDGVDLDISTEVLCTSTKTHAGAHTPGLRYSSATRYLGSGFVLRYSTMQASYAAISVRHAARPSFATAGFCERMRRKILAKGAEEADKQTSRQAGDATERAEK